MKTMRVLILLTLAAVLGGVVGTAQGSIAGAPVGIDPFQFFFDEWGNGWYQAWSSTGYGSPVNAYSFIVNGYLTYQLPDTVTAGDVGIYEPGTTVISDGLRFKDNLMQYFSDPGDSAPADTGFPADFLPTFFVNEVGPEGDNGFTYVAGNGDPAFTNFYFGTSDGTIPEPTTLIIWSLFVGVGIVFGYWRKRKTV